MADQDLPVTGKDIRVQVVVNGQLVITSSQATAFEDSDDNEEIVTKPLGTSRRFIDRIFEGHSGSITFANSAPDLELIRDEINTARTLRLPIIVNVTRRIFYRNADSVAHTYSDLKVDFSSSDSRGEAREVTMAWTTGEPRVRLAA